MLLHQHIRQHARGGMRFQPLMTRQAKQSHHTILEGLKQSKIHVLALKEKEKKYHWCSSERILTAGLLSSCHFFVPLTVTLVLVVSSWLVHATVFEITLQWLWCWRDTSSRMCECCWCMSAQCSFGMPFVSAGLHLCPLIFSVFIFSMHA